MFCLPRPAQQQEVGDFVCSVVGIVDKTQLNSNCIFFFVLFHYINANIRLGYKASIGAVCVHSKYFFGAQRSLCREQVRESDGLWALSRNCTPGVYGSLEEFFFHLYFPFRSSFPFSRLESQIRNDNIDFSIFTAEFRHVLQSLIALKMGI